MIADPAPYHRLAAALRERIAVIEDRDFYERAPAGHLEKLKEVSGRITDLAVELPDPISPDLAHYLHRASFAKALAWIEENVPQP